jgi:hypothetical protein
VSHVRRTTAQSRLTLSTRTRRNQLLLNIDSARTTSAEVYLGYSREPTVISSSLQYAHVEPICSRAEGIQLREERLRLSKSFRQSLKAPNERVGRRSHVAYVDDGTIAALAHDKRGEDEP